MSIKYPTPLADRVIILPEETKVEEKKSFFETPEELKQKPLKGTVKAVGKGYVAKDTGTLIEMEVVVGDVVMFNRFGGAEITIEGIPHIMVKQDDITLKQ